MVLTKSQVHALIIEDDQAMASLMEGHLGRLGHTTRSAQNLAAAESLLKHEGPFDLIVCDVRLGSDDGLELIERLQSGSDGQTEAPPAVIVITAFGSLETALRAFRAGATDFLTKPFELKQLTLTVERVLETRRLRGEIKRLQRALDGQEGREVVAESQAMRAVFELVDRVADTSSTLLVTGPSGAGKEVVARAIHDRSSRRSGPFVAINCAALPEQLLESELFGYRRGAFTDARTNKDGLFTSAQGGTLLLDEFGELPLSLQPKLLRVLQSREVLPLGAAQPVPVDVRIIAATNRPLDRLVAEKAFREDLYYRVAVIGIEVPPLSARKEDIIPLARAHLRRLERRLGRTLSLSRAAEAALLGHGWPGNVRELENAVERAAILCAGTEIEPGDLPTSVQNLPATRVVDNAIARGLTLEQFANEYCQAVVQHYGGRKAAALKHLDIDRKTLARRIQSSEDDL